MPTKTKDIVLASPPKLLPGHRCDRCGAQAQVMVAYPHNGHNLLLCGHHFQSGIPQFVRTEVRISNAAGQILDYTKPTSFTAKERFLVEAVFKQISANVKNDGF